MSDYLDEALEDSERSELEEHLEGCEECRETLVELREVVAQARRLVDAPPVRDLWPGIAERIRATEERERRGRSFTFSMPQLAAAAITLVALSSGIAWQAAGGFSTRQTEPAAPVAQVPAKAELLLASRIASSDYESAIAQLERVLDVGRERLDTATVRKVDEKLALIDKAIDDARQALAVDPSSAYLNRHLAGTMRRKLDLLRRTAALTEL
ncbi:MAG: anti-sigma factor [Gemmatimonadales bacterium]